MSSRCYLIINIMSHVVSHVILQIVNIIYSNLCPLQVCICGFSIATGGASRFISGYDSYGNTCGQNNTKIEGVPLSGRNMKENKLVCYVTNALTCDMGLYLH